MSNKILISIKLVILMLFPVGIIHSQYSGDPAYNENLNTYRIVAVKNLNEQIVSVSNTVSVEKPYTLYVPNAFSPDNDGINDYFRILGQGLTDIEVEVYNRWGQMVFKSYDMDDQWDGRFKGKMMPVGSYVYKIKTKDYGSDQNFLKSGTVALIR
jgi:gliding motility-associated-like protein